MSIQLNFFATEMHVQAQHFKNRLTTYAPYYEYLEFFYTVNVCTYTGCAQQRGLEFQHASASKEPLLCSEN